MGVRETGGATGAVATHIGNGAVGIEKLPAKISLPRIFNENKAIGPHRKFTLANRSSKALSGGGISKERLPVINQDEVITSPAHLGKFDRVIHLSPNFPK